MSSNSHRLRCGRQASLARVFIKMYTLLHKLWFCESRWNFNDFYTEITELTFSSKLKYGYCCGNIYAIFVVMPSPRSFAASGLDDVNDFDLDDLGSTLDIVHEWVPSFNFFCYELSYGYYTSEVYNELNLRIKLKLYSLLYVAFHRSTWWRLSR